MPSNETKIVKAAPKKDDAQKTLSVSNSSRLTWEHLSLVQSIKASLKSD